MNPLFRKLNYRDQRAIYILDAPDSFVAELTEMRAVAEVADSFQGAKDAGFAMAFATTQTQVDAFAGQVGAATSGDAVVWIAYPKATSKRYACEFNRDTGWTSMGAQGFEPVRQVSVDEDWSALRFRRVEYIKRMVRTFAMTEDGRRKAGASRPAVE